MRYSQLETITELVPGRKLVATRTLQANEHYLLDHFPRFPVMPGVMMLEALHQAAFWMIYTGDDFAYPLVLLREAKGVKFGDFLAPGETLVVTAEWMKEADNIVTVKAKACKGDKTTVSARLILEKKLTGDPDRLATDEFVRGQMKKQFSELFGQPVSATA
ncbi:3-hydroxyacyl-[acyl-carrier-protein] dehydratase FabZ [Roseimaritima ulvae]|uniref:3-hydroxyacyl-[acyl-carrier-protein] dehydratase FabZ n=1 Tax=Roseimaritima ulvae TaxID=980254 RepID=A0A5B9QNI0_9BACT|nr:beta-hydroxyacyl-ACP dehydratase [Roseimaritima ulvae]QEG39035.1 3-hydroxyacyl-[acyl-carrier-protein] dehydratase FabZ [Roseimaritima ulvae]